MKISFKRVLQGATGIVVGLLISLAPALSTSGSALAADKLKIGYIYPSPVGDVGWAYQLDEGRKAIEEKFGDKVESIVIENVAEGPDVPRILGQMTSQGANMIMLGSFGYMNDGLKLAKQNPEMTFIHASGYKTAENFGNFQTRNYEGAYLAGMAAGYVTKSNTLGAVAAYAIPEVIGILNAFTLGAQVTNPDISVKVVWLNSWFDPSKAQESARSLVAQKSDVIFSIYQDTPSVVTVCEELGVHVINTSTDMKKYAPNKLLTSIQIDWSPHFINSVQATLDGTYEGIAYWGGMKDGAIRMASWSPDLNAEQMAAIEAKTAEISDGSFHPLTGPVMDQAGKERLAAGVAIADGDMLGIDWLVKGVETQLPK